MKTTPRGGHEQDSSRSFEHGIEGKHNRDDEGTKETEYNADNYVHEQVRSTKRLAATIATHQRGYCGYEIRMENLRRSPTVARCCHLRHDTSAMTAEREALRMGVEQLT